MQDAQGNYICTNHVGYQADIIHKMSVAYYVPLVTEHYAVIVLP